MKWEKVNIEEIGFISSGGTPSTGNPAYWNGEIGWITPKDLSSYEFRYIINGERNISEEGLKNSSARLIRANSVLLSSRAPIGYLAIAEADLTTNQGFKNITPNEKCDSVFLFYCLKNNVEYLKSLGVGATYPELSATRLKEVKLSIPPLPIQRKIASILSAYDDLIENNLKRIKLLEEKAFASYKLIVKNEKLVEFNIEELANVVMGQSPTSDTYTNEKEENLPFHQGVTNFSNYFVKHKIYCKAPIKIAEEGDILFSVRAPVGRINFTSDKICIGRGLCAFRSKKGFQNYFYHQLKEFFFAEDVIGNGAIFNAVTKVELMKVKLKTPSEKIQQEFEIEAEQVYNLILNLTNQNTKLREARDILLHRLMNGQIEV
jgi:type I restriction enzyme S subunit